MAAVCQWHLPGPGTQAPLTSGPLSSPACPLWWASCVTPDGCQHFHPLTEPCPVPGSSQLPFLMDGDVGKSRGMLEFPPLVSVQVGLPGVRPKLDLLSVCWLTSLTRTLCSIFFTNIIPQGEVVTFWSKTCGSSRTWALASEDLGSNLTSAIFELCDLGEFLYFSVPQYPYLYNRTMSTPGL